MPVPDREYTSGELALLIGNLQQTLNEVKDTVATKEFVNAKFDNVIDRVRRAEDDIKELNKTNEAGHVQLEADSEKRHAETQSRIDSEVLLIRNDIKEVRETRKTDIKNQSALQIQVNSAKNVKYQVWVGAALVVLGNLVFWYVTTRV